MVRDVQSTKVVVQTQPLWIYGIISSYLCNRSLLRRSPNRRKHNRSCGCHEARSAKSLREFASRSEQSTRGRLYWPSPFPADCAIRCPRNRSREAVLQSTLRFVKPRTSFVNSLPSQAALTLEPKWLRTMMIMRMLMIMMMMMMMMIAICKCKYWPVAARCMQWY